MSENNEIRLPPSEPPPTPPPRGHDPQPQAEPSTFEGCFLALGKVLVALFIGVFVIGALVFATCFLSLRR